MSTVPIKKKYSKTTHTTNSKFSINFPYDFHIFILTYGKKIANTIACISRKRSICPPLQCACMRILSAFIYTTDNEK